LKSKELTDKLRSLYIRRTKDEVLKDALPMKDERIVFCEPSELQKLIYQHILEQPDFVLLRYV
jgi:SNF2 family DNA or RNA helicase